MKKFSDLGVTYEKKGFTGDKIKIDRILNRQIIVEKYEIRDSTKKANSKCLYLQILLNGESHVIFIGSVSLMEMIQQVNKNDFPFETMIIKESGQLKFT